LARRRADVDDFLSSRSCHVVLKALAETSSNAHIDSDPFAVGLRLAGHARSSTALGARCGHAVQGRVHNTIAGGVTLRTIKGRHLRIEPRASSAAFIDCFAGRARLRACARVSVAETFVNLLIQKTRGTVAALARVLPRQRVIVATISGLTVKTTGAVVVISVAHGARVNLRVRGGGASVHSALTSNSGNVALEPSAVAIRVGLGAILAVAGLAGRAGVRLGQVQRENIGGLSAVTKGPYYVPAARGVVHALVATGQLITLSPGNCQKSDEAESSHSSRR